MSERIFEQVYNPDVLQCLANLSNDEVFTPPDVANQMLDMLPQELFKNPNTKFLDPACKTGIFLREITKRLIIGLEPIIPDLKKRIEHILHNQVYGIAITELTSLLSRRSVYCSKYANSKYSVSEFDKPEGNIRFKRISHTWVGGKCKYCGASKKELNRDISFENYAYEFIHVDDAKEILNMKFDVVIGNPPYQYNLGNTEGNSSKAKAIYHKFINQAIALNSRYLIMITPSRWMTKSTEGISDEWVNTMLDCNKFEVIHDYPDASMCFPGVEIKGGVSYFKYNKDYNGKCDYYYHVSDEESFKRNGYLDSLKAGVVIRDPRTFSIIKKVIEVEGEYYLHDEKNFSGLVSPKDFFTNKLTLTSRWNGFKDKSDKSHYIKYYLNKSIHKKEYGWVKLDDVSKNHNSIPLNKVYISAAGGSGNDDVILGKPFVGDKNSVCSQTYLVIGYDPNKHNFSKKQCNNIISYISTRFFRYLVSVKKKTQNGPRGVYQFVPLQDFEKSWTDEELYKKYNLSKTEISLIEQSIRNFESEGAE